MASDRTLVDGSWHPHPTEPSQAIQLTPSLTRTPTSTLSPRYTTWPEAWGGCDDKQAPAAPYTCKQWTPGSASPTHGTLNGVGQIFISAFGGIRRPRGDGGGSVGGGGGGDDGVGVGYQTVVFDPPYHLASLGLTSAVASMETMYGTVSLSWEVAPDGSTSINVTVPPNVKSQVLFPATHTIAERGRPLTAHTVAERGRTLTAQAAPNAGVAVSGSERLGGVGVPGATGVDQLERATVVRVGSGSYEFVSFTTKDI
jgi:hypothetical protein